MQQDRGKIAQFIHIGASFTLYDTWLVCGHEPSVEVKGVHRGLHHLHKAPTQFCRTGRLHFSHMCSLSALTFGVYRHDLDYSTHYLFALYSAPSSSRGWMQLTCTSTCVEKVQRSYALSVEMAVQALARGEKYLGDCAFGEIKSSRPTPVNPAPNLGDYILLITIIVYGNLDKMSLARKDPNRL